MVTPYVVFKGNCKGDLDFYEIVFKSKVKTTRPYGKYASQFTCQS